MFNGEIHYKMVVFNSYVKLPEGKQKKTEDGHEDGNEAERWGDGYVLIVS